MKKILIIVGGKKDVLNPFIEVAKTLELDLTTASFSELHYLLSNEQGKLIIGNRPLNVIDIVYIRLVGKRLEEASLLVDFAKEKGIKIVDRIYEKSQYIHLPLSKSLETRLLAKSSLPVPNTLFGSILYLAEVAPKEFGFPFVIKSTTGKQGHEVWAPRNAGELSELLIELKIKEKEGKRFLAQEFIKATQRNRILVVGGKAIAGITRPTKWNRRFSEKERVKSALMPIPLEDANLAVAAANALSIDIAGVDIIHDDKTGAPYILEVNSAPRWESIKKEAPINVEGEILKFLSSLL